MRDDFQPLIDGDTERFGPTRGQVHVWAAGNGRVELSFPDKGNYVLGPEDLKEFAFWLDRIVRPSIENINACVEAEPDEG